MAGIPSCRCGGRLVAWAATRRDTISWTEPAPAGDSHPDDDRFSKDADNRPARILDGDDRRSLADGRSRSREERVSRRDAKGGAEKAQRRKNSLQRDGGSAGCPRTAGHARGFRLGHAGPAPTPTSASGAASVRRGLRQFVEHLGRWGDVGSPFAVGQMQSSTPGWRDVPEAPDALAFVIALIGHVVLADVPLRPVAFTVVDVVLGPGSRNGPDPRRS